MSATARLLRDRNFVTFWFGQTLSGLGDAFAMIAIPLLVLQATGSVAQMGLVTATMGVANLLAGIFAGSLVDRLDRRRLMIMCDLGRTIVYSLIPLGWLIIGPQIWIVYVVAAPGAALGMVFNVGYVAAMPNLVDKDQITDANSRMQITYGIAWVAGPMLAGVVIAHFNQATAIGIDAFSFLVSAVSLSLIRFRRAAGPVHGASQERPSWLGELLAGIRFVFHHPLLRVVTIVFALVNLVMMGSMDLFIFRMKHDLHMSAGTVGFVLGVASLGAIAAGLLAPAARRRFGFGACWIGGLLGTGVSLGAFAFATTVPAIAVLAVMFVCVNTVMGIMNVSLRQEITPDHLLGRVTAAFWMLAGVASPVGAAASTSLAAVFGAPAVLGGTGLIVSVLAAACVFSPVRHRRPEVLYAQH